MIEYFQNSQILAAYAVFVMFVLSPGPSFVAILATATCQGRAAAIALTFGIVTGSAFWGFCAALGMAAIMTKLGFLMVFSKIAGALYLFYLAFKSFTAAYKFQSNDPSKYAENKNLSGYYYSGLLLHLTNPKAIFGWLAVITLANVSNAPAHQSLVFVLGGVAISWIGHMLYPLLFSNQRVADTIARAGRWIKLVAGCTFSFVGLRLILDRS